MNLIESWPRSGTTADLPQLNSAFGMASMVKEVDIIGANVTGDKQIRLYLRYEGNESNLLIERVCCNLNSVTS